MKRRIHRVAPVPSTRKKSQPTTVQAEAVRWASRVHLYLEGEDPRLVDKETRNLYRSIAGTGARLLGPIPLPVRRAGKDPGESKRIHRRLVTILCPTERTVSLLEKLPLSSAVKAEIEVEESENEGNT